MPDSLRQSILQLQNLERPFYAHTGQLDLSKYVFNPVNLSAEQALFWERFDAGSVYNPQYRYAPLPSAQARLVAHIQALLPDLVEAARALPANVFTRAFLNILEAEHESLRLLEGPRDDAFNHRLTALFGAPAPATVDQARTILAAPPPAPAPDARTMPAAAFAERIRHDLEHLGVSWPITEEAGLGSRFAVLPAQNMIKIKADYTFSIADYQRFIVHEVGAHIFRAENGRRQPLHMFRYGFKDYLATEEGLATVLEAQHGVLSGTVLRTYAGRALAASMVNRPFYDIVEVLVHHVPRADAFEIAHRVKRGLTDTARPGGFTKDYVYLQGHERIQRYLRHGGPLEPLFLGKIGVDDVAALWPFVDKGILTQPTYLPDSIPSLSGG